MGSLQSTWELYKNELKMFFSFHEMDIYPEWHLNKAVKTHSSHPDTTFIAWRVGAVKSAGRVGTEIFFCFF